ncbi:MAG TPA: creatininase family protein [Geminicoccaceae bacterium]
MAELHDLARMTSVEFKAALPGIGLAILPVGAIEQHGPNLALSTDIATASGLARQLAERLHPRAVLLPPVPYGLSYHHTGFAGTITFQPETFIAIGVDIARSLKRDGIRRLLFVNGHNGNMAVLNVLTQKLRYEVGIEAATSFYFAQAADRMKAHAKTERWGHACEIESSVLMALAPDLVRKDAFEPGRMIETGLAHGVPNAPFAVQMAMPFHEQTENGVFGDARLADPEIGRDIVATALDRTVAFAESWLERPLADG